MYQLTRGRHLSSHFTLDYPIHWGNDEQFNWSNKLCKPFGSIYVVQTKLSTIDLESMILKLQNFSNIKSQVQSQHGWEALTTWLTVSEEYELSEGHQQLHEPSGGIVLSFSKVKASGLARLGSACFVSSGSAFKTHLRLMNDMPDIGCPSTLTLQFLPFTNDFVK